MKTCLGDADLAFEIINEKFNYVESASNNQSKIGIDTLKQIIDCLLPLPYQQLNQEITTIFKTFSEDDDQPSGFMSFFRKSS